LGGWAESRKRERVERERERESQRERERGRRKEEGRQRARIFLHTDLGQSVDQTSEDKNLNPKPLTLNPKL